MPTPLTLLLISTRKKGCLTEQIQRKPVVVLNGKRMKISICHPCVLRHGGDHVLDVVDDFAVDPPGDVEQAVHAALDGEAPLQPHRRRTLLHAGALVNHFLGIQEELLALTSSKV